MAANEQAETSGQKALEQQGEISRVLGRVEGQLTQLQNSVDNMRERMDREHRDVGERVSHLETRMRRQDQKLLAAVCTIIAFIGAGAGGEHLVRFLTAFL